MPIGRHGQRFRSLIVADRESGLAECLRQGFAIAAEHDRRAARARSAASDVIGQHAMIALIGDKSHAAIDRQTFSVALGLAAQDFAHRIAHG